MSTFSLSQPLPANTVNVPSIGGALALAIDAELARARAKFPRSENCFAALAEEMGELAKALLEKKSDEVYAEGVQVAVMAIRVITEGDPNVFPAQPAKNYDTEPPFAQTQFGPQSFVDKPRHIGLQRDQEAADKKAAFEAHIEKCLRELVEGAFFFATAKMCQDAIEALEDD